MQTRFGVMNRRREDSVINNIIWMYGEYVKDEVMARGEVSDWQGRLTSK